MRYPRSQIVHKTQDALIYHPRRTPSLARRRHAPGHLQLAAFSSLVSIITHMFTRLSITKVDYHRRFTVHGANFRTQKELVCRVRTTALARLTRSSPSLGLSPAR
jgi:hypothetical protein